MKIKKQIMIITRKIQIFVCEEDIKLKKQFIHIIYEWRDYVRKAANKIVAHRFFQDQVVEFDYLKKEIKEKLMLTNDILKDEKGYSKDNVTYKVASEYIDGRVPSDVITCLNQKISSSYKNTNRKDIYMGKAQLTSFKNNIPIPFSAKSLRDMHFEDNSSNKEQKYKGCFFTLFGIPFQMAFGRDRSGNRIIIERILYDNNNNKMHRKSENLPEKYKLKSSSIVIDDHKKKMFLYLTVDIPKKQIKLIKNSILYAYLSVANPITWIFDDKCDVIGNKEEFLYQRLQIQNAIQRLQKNLKYTKGGHGRNHKLIAIDRFHKKETNYISTKLHTYSKHLIDAAQNNQCAKIILVNQSEKEDTAKQDQFILRNWGYYGLKEKIEYKANIYGITISEQKV